MYWSHVVSIELILLYIFRRWEWVEYLWQILIDFMNFLYCLFLCSSLLFCYLIAKFSVFLLYIMSHDLLYFLILIFFGLLLSLGLGFEFEMQYLCLKDLFRFVYFTVITLILLLLCYLVVGIKTNAWVTFIIFEYKITEEFLSSWILTLDLLTVTISILLLILLTIVLLFGLEYLVGEAAVFSTIQTLCAFTAFILFFVSAHTLTSMLIFWELSGLFSFVLVSSFYYRIRSTQAVSRAFIIGRASDYFFMCGLCVVYAVLNNDDVSFLTQEFIISLLLDEAEIFIVYTTTWVDIICFLFFFAACFKSAQLLVFVWLPDAMEAPTPASALIHSSTLVVIGIFLILKLSALFRQSENIAVMMSLIGCLTIVYGALFSIITPDLKKAVAYSTISQVGYILCGCGFFAYQEVLCYLFIHAVCKALLFVIVGYVIHLFGGSTSIRKMGGIFYIVPDLAIFTIILCSILAGLPYTIGFYAKDYIIARISLTLNWYSIFVLSCWFFSFICTPIYLYRICIVVFFGTPRASWCRFKHFYFLKNNKIYFLFKKVKTFEQLNALSKNNSIFVFFICYLRNLRVSSRLTIYLLFIFLILILFCGEFILLLFSGAFPVDNAALASFDNNITWFYAFNLQLGTNYRSLEFVCLALLNFVIVALYIISGLKALTENSYQKITLCLWILLLIVISILIHQTCHLILL